MREVDVPTDSLPAGFTPAGPGGMGPGAGGGMSAEQAEARKAQQEEMEARRQFMLDQILTPEAKERLSRIAIVRADKARAVEDMLLGAATSGRLPGKVTEERLVELLEQVQEKKATTKVTIMRRRFDEDDDDNDDDLL